MEKKFIFRKFMFLLMAFSTVFVGTTLIGCSDGDDEDGLKSTICGYWEKTTPMAEGRYGLLFQDGGNIKSWSVSSGRYYEIDWGIYWYKDGEIHIKMGTKDPFPDEMYYKIVSLLDSRLVIRAYGGVAGTSYENGQNEEYRKLPDRPTNSDK